MYVCLCNGVTDTQIKSAVAEGCDSLRDLRRTLNVATQCAKCARHARQVLKEARQVQHAAARESSPMVDALGVGLWAQTV